MAPALAIILPAAGASSRMGGRDKLLETVEGEPLLRRQVKRALATGNPVLVAVPSLDHPRARALEGLAASVVPVPDSDRGMSASLARAVRACPPGVGIMVLLPDMPEIETADLMRLADTFTSNDEARIVRAGEETGRPGHPVIFPAGMRPDLEALQGDMGARAILETAAEVTVVPLPGKRATVDLDTPQDWDRWRRRRKEQGWDRG